MSDCGWNARRAPATYHRRVRPIGSKRFRPLLPLAIALLAIFALAPPAHAARILAGAGGNQHGWVLLEGSGDGADGEGARLYHAPDAARVGTLFRAQRRTLPTAPERMAAWADELFLVFPADASGGPDAPLLRSVRALTVRGPVGPGFYTYIPEGQLRVLPALPGDAALLDLAATDEGPFALLGDDEGVRLLRLVDASWKEIALPREAARMDARLLPLDDGLGAVVVSDAGSTIFQRMEEGDEWEPSTLRAAPSDDRLIGTPYGVVAARSLGGGDVEIDLVREDNRFKLATLEDIPTNRTLFRVGETIAVVWTEGASDGARLQLAVISALTGEILHRGSPEQPSPVSRQDLQFLGVLLMAIMLTVLIFILRPAASAKTTVTLPEKTSLASPMSRLFAALVDLLPGLLIASRFYGVGAVETLTLPFSAGGAAGAMPFLAAMALFFLHSALSEWLWGRTLGKALLGLTTLSVTGGKLTPWQAVSRNVVKTLAPPLILLVFLDPRRRHAGDFISGSVVVAPIEEEEGEHLD